MYYARFQKVGYLIGSGTIESACKQIAAVRLKCSGACLEFARRDRHGQIQNQSVR